jgi:hypothetical protein
MYFSPISFRCGRLVLCKFNIVVSSGVKIDLHDSLQNFFKILFIYFVWLRWIVFCCLLHVIWIPRKYSIYSISIISNSDFRFFLVWGNNLYGSLGTIIQSTMYRTFIIKEFSSFFMSTLVSKVLCINLFFESNMCQFYHTMLLDFA